MGAVLAARVFAVIRFLEQGGPELGVSAQDLGDVPTAIRKDCRQRIQKAGSERGAISLVELDTLALRHHCLESSGRLRMPEDGFQGLR